MELIELAESNIAARRSFVALPADPIDLTVKADGTVVIAVESASAGSQVLAVATDTGDVTILAEFPSRIQRIAAEPSGDRLLVITDEGDLYQITGDASELLATGIVAAAW